MTVPDPALVLTIISTGEQFVQLESNHEFTPQAQSPGFTVKYLSPDVVWLEGGYAPPPGTSDLTLEQTASGTVTCTGCIHGA